MTPRERYIATLTFQQVDKLPFRPGHPRESTRKRWAQEGLPLDAPLNEALTQVLDIDPAAFEHGIGLPCSFQMMPKFEEQVLSHQDGHYIVRDWMGAITEISDEYDYTYIRSAKDFVTRKWHKFPVENKSDWVKMKFRYDPNDASRIPENLAEIGKKIKNRAYPIVINVNGPFWQLREWMGMENLCVAFLDEPDFVSEMIDFWCGYVLELFEKFLPHVAVDGVHISEDMAFKAHSMISPTMTREFLMPVYKKWSRKLFDAGVPILDMDSDGFIEELIPIWIESGINVCDPIEVAAHNDIVKFRGMFGNKMAFQGGVDKRAMAAGGRELSNEINRVAKVMETGGYIPACDHGIPHDVSFINYREYVRLLAKITGWI